MHLFRKLSFLHIHLFQNEDRSLWKIMLFTVLLLSCAVVIGSLWILPASIAQEGSTVSGRLLDTTGNPIPDIAIYLSRSDALNQNNSRRTNDSVQIKTDSNGGFVFSDIRNTALQLGLSSYTKIGYEINVLSIKFGEITLYPERGWVRSKIDFGIDTGSKYEGIITADIRKELRIRTRVVYADGSPVANERIYVYRQTIPFVGRDRGYGQLIKETDAEGYFVEYLPRSEYPTYFITLAVEHQNLYAKAVPFIKKDNTELVLELNGVPGSHNDPPLEHSARFFALETYIDQPPVWMVNPANNHAYIVTQPLSIKDAMAQAASENAYLVTVNDEAEQKWLSYVFGNGRFLIGLSDAEEEGKWKWHSGEPVNYTNWEPYEKESGNSDANDYVITGHFDLKWEVIGDTYKLPNSQVRTLRIGRAIIEQPTKSFE